jgi:hypothetical protein
MGGLYDLLETYKIQNDPRFAYEGLYQDPRRDDTTYYSGDLKDPYGYVFGNVDNLQAKLFSSFPQDYGVGSLFNPRVGKSRQSIYFNEPSLNAPQDFYQPIGDPFQTDYPTTRTIQEDEDEDLMSQEVTAPYTGVTGIGYQTPRTIADQNAVLGRTFTKQPTGIAKLFDMLGNVPTPFNLARKALGGIFGGLKGLNTKIQGTTFALSPTLKDYFAAKKMEKIAEKGADVGIGPGGTGSRRGDADIAGKDRGSFKTDDTAGFF